MICSPCKQQDHWNCPDVVRARVVRVRGNPGKLTGRMPTEQNGWSPHTGWCDCQHESSAGTSRLETGTAPALLRS